MLLQAPVDYWNQTVLDSWMLLYIYTLKSGNWNIFLISPFYCHIYHLSCSASQPHIFWVTELCQTSTGNVMRVDPNQVLSIRSYVEKENEVVFFFFFYNLIPIQLARSEPWNWWSSEQPEYKTLIQLPARRKRMPTHSCVIFNRLHTEVLGSIWRWRVDDFTRPWWKLAILFPFCNSSSHVESLHGCYWVYKEPCM